MSDMCDYERLQVQGVDDVQAGRIGPAQPGQLWERAYLGVPLHGPSVPLRQDRSMRIQHGVYRDDKLVRPVRHDE